MQLVVNSVICIFYSPYKCRYLRAVSQNIKIQNKTFKIGSFLHFYEIVLFSSLDC